MPSKSKAQARFMAAVAHSPEFAKKVGVPMSVGKDFNQADKGRKFGKGGDVMARDAGAGRGFVNPPVVKPREDRTVGEQQMLDEVNDAKMRKKVADMGYAKGGKVAKKMPPFMGKESAKEENMEKRLSPAKYKAGEMSEGEMMACGGKVKKYAAGGKIDGIAQRGKTRGKVC